jgi:AcrR family transcriptional regulator
LESTTKIQILDAAERLFADAGLEATSLRQIISLAEVNLAAVHYHFGSKEALVEAVLIRRLDPLNQERLRLLDLEEAKAAGKPVSVERIITALVAPALRMSRDSNRGGENLMRLLGRIFTVPNENIQRMLVKRFREVFERFARALQRALPGLLPEDFHWRFHFMIGAMGFTMCKSDHARIFSNQICDPDDVEGLIERLVLFVSAGMAAPASKAARGGSRARGNLALEKRRGR